MDQKTVLQFANYVSSEMDQITNEEFARYFQYHEIVVDKEKKETIAHETVEDIKGVQFGREFYGYRKKYRCAKTKKIFVEIVLVITTQENGSPKATIETNRFWEKEIADQAHR